MENKRKLETIQTKENLNSVYAVGEKGPGGAYHNYSIVSADTERIYLDMAFQKGPRHEEDSQHGIIDSDLLEIVRDRLTAFQEGPYASGYNAIALSHIELALSCLNKRVEDRIARNVLGVNKK